ncbi:hypothetical protein RFG91_004827 [Klebsiella aerogenes]|nr:hypothetical protein [Klebsiella aerogenes]
MFLGRSKQQQPVRNLLQLATPEAMNQIWFLLIVCMMLDQWPSFSHFQFY